MTVDWTRKIASFGLVLIFSMCATTVLAQDECKEKCDDNTNWSDDCKAVCKINCDDDDGGKSSACSQNGDEITLTYTDKNTGITGCSVVYVKDEQGNWVEKANTRICPIMMRGFGARGANPCCRARRCCRGGGLLQRLRMRRSNCCCPRIRCCCNRGCCPPTCGCNSCCN